VNVLPVELGQTDEGPAMEQPTATIWPQEVLPLLAVKVTLIS
jgi:hypothetical protein